MKIVTFRDMLNPKSYNKNDDSQNFSPAWEEYEPYDSCQMSLPRIILAL